MHPRVEEVKPNSDHTLTLTFTNGEVKIFDVKPYLNIGIFQELKNLSAFNTVKSCLGSIQWQGGQDFCPDTLYLESKTQMPTQRARHALPTATRRRTLAPATATAKDAKAKGRAISSRSH